MGYHFGSGGSGSSINIITPAGSGGGGGAPKTAAKLISGGSKAAKKSSKGKGKGEPAGSGPAEPEIIAFEIVFTSSLSRQQVTIRVPGTGAFHDLARKTTLQDVVKLRNRLETALNSVFHLPTDPKRP